MYLSSSNVNISVNGSNILCQSINFTQNSSLKPIFNIGNKVSYNNIPTNLLNNLSLEYYLEPEIEPNYSIITGLIYDKSVAIPSIINLGDTYFTGYLKEYSMQVYPNSVIKIKSDFNIYNPITGNILEQALSGNYLYDSGNSSGISHYWTTQLKSGNQQIDANILQLEYSVSINQSPIYGIGDFQPKQIYIDSINESLDVISEQQNNIVYSGLLFDNTFIGVQSMTLTGSQNSPINISIPLTGFNLDDINTSISVDNIILFGHKFKRYN